MYELFENSRRILCDSHDKALCVMDLCRVPLYCGAANLSQGKHAEWCEVVVYSAITMKVDGFLMILRNESARGDAQVDASALQPGQTKSLATACWSST